VQPEIFRLFLEAIKGTSATITNQNFPELSQLCSEFVFNGLANELSAFCASPDFKDAQAADTRIRVLEERIDKVENRIATLKSILDLQVPKQEQSAEALSAALARVSQALKTTSAAAEQLRCDVRVLKTRIGAMDSRIVSVARDFHSRCDDHANTVTLILTAASEHDVGGFVFGGFTPVKWDSWSDWKSDDSLKSFLFTLKNPHNISARKFGKQNSSTIRSSTCR
jgi:hypothetical protein